MTALADLLVDTAIELTFNYPGHGFMQGVAFSMLKVAEWLYR